MSKLSENLLQQDDLRARLVARKIEYLDGLRQQGFRSTEISIDAYEALLMENLSLQISQRAHMKAYGELLAMSPQPLMMQRGTSPVVPTVPIAEPDKR